MSEIKNKTANQQQVYEVVDDTASKAERKERDSRIEQLKELRKKYLIDLKKKYPPEVCLLEILGIPFLAKGDICAIKAKQKQGKTHAIAVMIAALLGCTLFRIKALLKKVKILYFDTEQKEADTQEICLKVCRLSGLSVKENDYDRLQVWHTSDMNPADLNDSISLIIEEEKPDVVFIDGIIDMVDDFNDLASSKSFVWNLCQLAQQNNCAIVGVIHTNKDEKDHNMRGHTGTIMAQKSAQVWECSKKDNVVIMTCTDTRKAPLSDWSFTWDGNGDIVPADELAASIKAAQKQSKEEAKELEKQKKAEAKFKEVREVFHMHQGCISRTELTEKLVVKLGVARPTVSNYITKLITEEKLKVVAENYLDLADGE